jgi:hypothetical protein
MRNLYVSLAVGVLIAGCGGGGSDSTGPTSTAQSSAIAKDPLTVYTGIS